MDKETAKQIAYDFLNDGPIAEMHHQLGYEYFIREKPIVESRKHWVFAYGGRTIDDHEEQTLFGGSQGVAVNKRTGSVERVFEQGLSTRTAFMLHISRHEFAPVIWILARVFIVAETMWMIVTLIPESLPSLPNFKKKSQK